MGKHFIPVPWKPRPTLVLSKREFEDLPEYSCSLPTGTTIGKRWKRDRNFGRRSDRVGPEWDVAEYAESEIPGMVDIHWYDVEIAHSGEVRDGKEQK